MLIHIPSRMIAWRRRIAWIDNLPQPDGCRNYTGSIPAYPSEYQEVHLGRVRQGRSRPERSSCGKRVGNGNGA
jgi:hypothetical protein